MKRIIPHFLVLLVICVITFVLPNDEPKLVEDSEKTVTAVITDRAMSGNMPYIGVNFEDGTALCLWDVQNDVIPDDIRIGDTVTVTYGKQDGFDRYIVLKVTKK